MRYIQDDHVYNTKIHYKQLYTPIIRVAYILYANTKCVFAENTNKNGIVFSKGLKKEEYSSYSSQISLDAQSVVGLSGVPNRLLDKSTTLS